MASLQVCSHNDEPCVGPDPRMLRRTRTHTQSTEAAAQASALLRASRHKQRRGRRADVLNAFTAVLGDPSVPTRSLARSVAPDQRLSSLLLLLLLLPLLEPTCYCSGLVSCLASCLPTTTRLPILSNQANALLSTYSARPAPTKRYSGCNGYAFPPTHTSTNTSTLHRVRRAKPDGAPDRRRSA